MLLDEVLQQRNQIVGAGGHGAVVQRHLTGGLSVLADHHAGGEAVVQHVVVVTHVVLGHDKGLFALRQHDLAVDKAEISILVRLFIGHVVEAHQHVTALVHGVQNALKLVRCGHHGIVALGIRIPVKGLGRVHDQGVEENVGDLGVIRFHHRVLGGQIAVYGLLTAGVRGSGGIALHQGHGPVVVVTGGQPVGLGDQPVHLIQRRLCGLCDFRVGGGAGGGRGDHLRVLGRPALFME